MRVAATVEVGLSPDEAAARVAVARWSIEPLVLRTWMRTAARPEPDRDQLDIFMNCLLGHRGHDGHLSRRAFTHSDKLLSPIIGEATVVVRSGGPAYQRVQDQFQNSRVRFTSVTKGLGHLCHVGIAGSVV